MPPVWNDLVERRTRRGKVFYGCGTYPTCDYATWDKPIAEACPQCGGMMASATRGKPRVYCTECEYERGVAAAGKELVAAQ